MCLKMRLITSSLSCVAKLFLFSVSKESIVLNFIYSTISSIKTAAKFYLNNLQVRYLSSTVLVSFLLMTSIVDSDLSPKAITKEIDKVIHQDKEQRPKTTQEWNKQSRETEDKPEERIQRIEKQSAEALKDFGSMYLDTAKRSASELEN